MRFVYQYKTHENERREGEIRADSREAVYAALKGKGIRPFKVELAPGVLNRIQSFGWRVFAIVVLSLVVAALSVVSCRLASGRARAFSPDEGFSATTRRQVIGDTAVIEKGVRTGWSDIFAEEGERFLASFAIPGVPAGLRNTSVAEIKAALARKVEAEPGDGIEARQIKSMVEGMKDELRRFVAKGGSIAQYGRLLVMRQEEEIGYFNRAKADVDAAKKAKKPAAEVERIWESCNDKLRRMGIKLVQMPE